MVYLNFSFIENFVIGYAAAYQLMTYQAVNDTVRTVIDTTKT